MKLRRKVKLLLCLIIGIILMIGGIVYLNKSDIEFKEDTVQVEIHSEYDPMTFISEITGGDKEDVKVDSSHVNKDKLGKYELIYHYDDEEYILDIEIVDTIAPQFEVQDVDIDLGEEVLVENIVKNIEDSTQTKSYFKEDYSFENPGEQEVIVVVEDEAKNKTEKAVKVIIVKDEEKPTLTGVKDLTVYQNQKINFLANIKAKDNRDPQPEISVDSSKVRLDQIGEYEIKYTVQDKSGNKNEYIKKVKVIEKKPITVIPPTGDKTVYLTFDDGPSLNTAKILDILAKYNAKATFFVTGTNQKYNYLIKRAHDEGHTIGLHTYTHEYDEVYASVDAYFDDLNKVGEMVKKQIGFIPRYIRFPGGSSNTTSRKYCKGIMSVLTSEVQKRGYQYYDWNVSTGDAASKKATADQIVKNSTKSKANNIMILGHDTRAKTTTVEALPRIIEHYQALGYTFKGIDDNSFTPHHGVNN